MWLFRIHGPWFGLPPAWAPAAAAGRGVTEMGARNRGLVRLLFLVSCGITSVLSFSLTPANSPRILLRRTLPVCSIADSSGKEDPRLLGSRRLYRLFHRQKVTADPVPQEKLQKLPSDEDASSLLKVILAAKLQSELDSRADTPTPNKPSAAKAAVTAPSSSAPKADNDTFDARMASLADAVQQTIEVPSPPRDSAHP